MGHLGKRRGRTEGMLSYWSCHCRLSGSLPGVQGCPHIQAVSLGCVWRGLEKTMWKLEMSLGRGAFWDARSALLWSCLTQLPLNWGLGEEMTRRASFLWVVCKCTGNTAATNVAMQKPCMGFFVLAHFIRITCHEATDRIYYYYYILLFMWSWNCCTQRLNLLIPGHSAERWLYLDMTGLLFNWTKLMSKLPLKWGAPWLLVIWQCLSHSQTGL